MLKRKGKADVAGASASRHGKLQRLEGFRRQLPFVSCSALSSILDAVEREGVPELHRRKHMKEAVVQMTDGFNSYGAIIPN